MNIFEWAGHLIHPEEDKDNLGVQQGEQFVPIDEVADPSAQIPGEEQEEYEEATLEATTQETDDEPSNWEADVEAGKYNEVSADQTESVTEINPVHTQSRGNIAQIEEMKSGEQKDKYWDAAERKTDNAKPKRPQDDRDSIRFQGDDQAA